MGLRPWAEAAGDIDQTGPEPCPGLPPVTGAQLLALTGLAADADPSSDPPARQSPWLPEESEDGDWRRRSGRPRPPADRETARETGEVPVTPP